MVTRALHELSVNSISAGDGSDGLSFLIMLRRSSVPPSKNSTL